MEQTQETFWYAARVFKSRHYIKESAARRGFQLYVATQIPTLFFIRCSKKQMLEFLIDMQGLLSFYRNLQTHQIRIVPDKEMEMFMIVTSAKDEPVFALDIQDPEFFQGQLVRVIDGPFKGAEGIIKRIKGDRRLLVQVTGVGVIATSFIPPQYLEKVEK